MKKQEIFRLLLWLTCFLLVADAFWNNEGLFQVYNAVKQEYMSYVPSSDTILGEVLWWILEAFYFLFPFIEIACSIVGWLGLFGRLDSKKIKVFSILQIGIVFAFLVLFFAWNYIRFPSIQSAFEALVYELHFLIIPSLFLLAGIYGYKKDLLVKKVSSESLTLYFLRIGVLGFCVVILFGALLTAPGRSLVQYNAEREIMNVIEKSKGSWETFSRLLILSSSEIFRLLRISVAITGIHVFVQRIKGRTGLMITIISLALILLIYIIYTFSLDLETNLYILSGMYLPTLLRRVIENVIVLFGIGTLCVLIWYHEKKEKASRIKGEE